MAMPAQTQFASISSTIEASTGLTVTLPRHCPICQKSAIENTQASTTTQQSNTLTLKMRLENIPKHQVHLLASILQQPPSEALVRYAERIYYIEPQLDRDVLRPGFLHRLVQLPQSHYACLCGLHKMLNAKIVHQIFVLVATEVGLRMNSIVVAGRDKVGHVTWDCSILNLRSLHGAWLDPEVFRDTFGHTLDVANHAYSQEDYMIKWVPEEYKCEACVLTRIGGDIDTVFDLQMVVKSRIPTRSTRKYREPRLMNVIEGWLEMWKLHFGADQWKAKIEWNEVRARRLKDARKEIAKANRKGRSSSRSHRRPHITSPLVSYEPRHPATDPTGNPPRPQSDETARIFFPSKSGETARIFIPSKFDEKLEPVSDDDNDGAEVRDTAYDVENELIDCYAALISTPFLPGMNDQEHQKRASTLSRHSVSTGTRDVAAWPMVNRVGTTNDKMATSAYTEHKRLSKYTESVYSQPSTPFPLKPQVGLPSSLKRSKTFQGRRASDKSWMTASFAPSTVDPQRTQPNGDRGRQQKANRFFDSILEESLIPQETHNNDNDTLISPLEGHGRVTEQSRYMVSSRSGSDSPVSSVSMEYVCNIARPSSYVEYQTQSVGQDRCQGGTGPSAATVAEPDCLVEARQDSLRPDIGPRLSKPFEGPAPISESETLLASVQRLRQNSSLRRTQSDRQSSKTNTTQWIDLYGSEVERIQHPRSDSKSKESKRSR